MLQFLLRLCNNLVSFGFDFPGQLFSLMSNDQAAFDGTAQHGTPHVLARSLTEDRSQYETTDDLVHTCPRNYEVVSASRSDFASAAISSTSSFTLDATCWTYRPAFIPPLTR